jgi:hypothetical protein
MGEAVFAQLDPLPTNLEGYQRFWAAQRSRDPGSEPVAPTGASLLGDPITLAEAQSSSRLAATAAPSVPPLPASAPVEGSPPEKALTPEELNRQRLQPLLAEGAAAHARRQAQQAQAQATPSSRSASSTTPTAAVPTLDSLRSSQPATSQAADLQVEEQPGQHPNEARRLPVPPPRVHRREPGRCSRAREAWFGSGGAASPDLDPASRRELELGRRPFFHRHSEGSSNRN